MLLDQSVMSLQKVTNRNFISESHHSLLCWFDSYSSANPLLFSSLLSTNRHYIYYYYSPANPLLFSSLFGSTPNHPINIIFLLFSRIMSMNRLYIYYSCLIVVVMFSSAAVCSLTINSL